jgi:hypothetical protein
MIHGSENLRNLILGIAQVELLGGMGKSLMGNPPSPLRMAMAPGDLLGEGDNIIGGN